MSGHRGQHRPHGRDEENHPPHLQLQGGIRGENHAGCVILHQLQQLEKTRGRHHPARRGVGQPGLGLSLARTATTMCGSSTSGPVEHYLRLDRTPGRAGASHRRGAGHQRLGFGQGPAAAPRLQPHALRVVPVAHRLSEPRRCSSPSCPSIRAYFSADRSGLWHYLSTAEGNYREYLRGRAGCRVKEVFLRPAPPAGLPLDPGEPGARRRPCCFTESGGYPPRAGAAARLCEELLRDKDGRVGGRTGNAPDRRAQYLY